MSRRRIVFVCATALAAGIWVVDHVPSTIRQGINFQQHTITEPLFLKALDFIDRHHHYRLLARDITQGARSDEERMLRLFQWTHEHIRPVPESLPIVDDHIWHIIVRGYGTNDQVNDVFTTLCVYAGLPAFWQWLSAGSPAQKFAVSFVKLQNRWVVVDPSHQRVFRRPDGTWAGPEDLRADPALVSRGTKPLLVYGVPYERYFAGFPTVQEPRALRAKLQMPLYRLWYEVNRRTGFVR